MAPGSHVVAYEDGTWVTTSTGPVKLEQGDTLPDDVHPDEVARLANAGILEGLEQEPALVGIGGEDDTPSGDQLPDGSVKDLKVRIGTDAELARAYLEREQEREQPRATFVEHLEQVIAADEERTEPGTPLVDETAGVRPQV